MADSLFLRRDTLSLTAILTLPELAGTLFAADILPEIVWQAVKVILFPAWFLDLEIGRSVNGGVGGLYELLFINNGWNTPTLSVLWSIGVLLLVMYSVAVVSIYLGMLLAATIEVVPNGPWRRAIVGTIVTVGIISLVANTIQWLTDTPLQRQTFHPEGVAGSLTLLILVLVVLILHQKTSVT